MSHQIKAKPVVRPNDPRHSPGVAAIADLGAFYDAIVLRL